MPTVTHSYDDDRYDRITVTFFKGYKKLFKRLSLEINSDTSKIFRDALEQFIQANRHRMSDDLRKYHDKLRKLGPIGYE